MDELQAAEKPHPGVVAHVVPSHDGNPHGNAAGGSAVTVPVDNPAPAVYDLGQIRALAQARFGAGIDCNEVRPDIIRVYLPSTPNPAAATAWTNDLATYTLTHPTAADVATNLAALQTKAQTALTNNATFQAIASPSNAQTLAQVQALTKQCNGIIRLLLNLTDTTSGT
jgi:hypothetical protein